MKVTPVASPHAMSQTQTTTSNTDARAKAIAILEGKSHQQPQQQIVQNQNSISVEEVGAIIPQPNIQVAESTQQTQDTNTTTEATTESADTTGQTTETTKAKVDPALSRQFAQLARQEKALRAKAQAQEQAIKAREDALKAKETQITGLEQQYKSGYISLDQLKTDTLAVLANAGVSYDELTQQILNQQPTDPRLNAHIARLEAKIQELTVKAESTEKTAQEAQQAQYKAALNQIKADVKQLVSKDPSFETIRATNSVNDVVELIEATYQKDGVVLSVEEAAQEVEDYLVEEAMKITKIGKIKQRISQASAPAAKTETKTQAPAANKEQPQMKTLTNSAASTRKLSAKERAILAFKGELGKG